MAGSGKLLARARARLDGIRQANRAERERRLAEVRAKLPRVEKIDAEMRAQMTELMRLAITHGRDISADTQKLERENLALQAERAECLAAAGLPADYTDEIFSCPVCRDTGMVGAEMCSCLKKLWNEEITRELGTLLQSGDESFDRFDLGLYDDVPGPGSGVSARQCMTIVRDTCLEYAKSFGPGSGSFIFSGGTGLGKTYLSACVARVVASRGFSVAYESTQTALNAFETQRFSRDQEEADSAAARVRQYLGCDLMILDDLGTEMLTSFSVSALYQIINTRLINKRATIISTNLDPSELARRYGAQIASRLDGEYTRLPFFGRDIRKIKKERAE